MGKRVGCGDAQERLIHDRRAFLGLGRVSIRTGRGLPVTIMLPFVQTKRLVFIYKKVVKTNPTRLRGRDPRGERLEMGSLFGNW